MQVKAHLKQAKVSPQKARLVADQVRGKTIDKALDVLTFSPKKSSDLIHKLVMSAVANAENNFGLDVDDLYISKISVDQGPVLKRVRARARGRACRIEKKMSHISLELSELSEKESQ